MIASILGPNHYFHCKHVWSSPIPGKFETHHFENHFKHDQKFDFDQTLSIREVDAPKKIQWDSKNRRIYWLNQDGKIYSSLENGDNLTELDLDGDYARGFDIYSQGSTNQSPATFPDFRRFIDPCLQCRQYNLLVKCKEESNIFNKTDTRWQWRAIGLI